MRTSGHMLTPPNAPIPPNAYLGGKVSRVTVVFSALVLAQFAHSTEEYVGRFWESFPPARFLTGLVSSDREWGFMVLSSALVAFGLWCLAFPVHKEWPSAMRFIWFWIVLEIINGSVHPVWTLRQGGYTPGVVTAPILLGIALYLAFSVREGSNSRAGKERR